MTTTSTTNYIDVDPPSICAFGHHDCPSGNCCNNENDTHGIAAAPHCGPGPCGCVDEGMSEFEHLCAASGFYPPIPSPTSETRRLLKKTRKTPSPPPPPPVSYDAPADPAEVLAREAYNHIYPRSPPGLMIRKQKSFAKAKEFLDKWTVNKKKTDESWVCVEVTHKVTQHVISEGSVGPARCGGR